MEKDFPEPMYIGVVENMDPIVGLIATFIMLAVYGTVKYAEKTFGPNPETWDSGKFAVLLSVGVIIVVGAWYLNGAVEMPTIEAFDQVMPFFTTVFGTLGASLTVLLGGKYAKKVAQTGKLVSKQTVEVAAAATESTLQYIGFTVTPTQMEGKSPFLAAFKIQCSTIAVGWSIDWKDGSAPQQGGFVTEGEYNVVTVYHLYNYQYDGKYTGHSFYPEITIVSKDGVKNTFNTEATGRCLSIIVNA